MEAKRQTLKIFNLKYLHISICKRIINNILHFVESAENLPCYSPPMIIF
jgi:hypothetical protein